MTSAVHSNSARSPPVASQKPSEPELPDSGTRTQIQCNPSPAGGTNLAKIGLVPCALSGPTLKNHKICHLDWSLGLQGGRRGLDARSTRFCLPKPEGEGGGESERMTVKLGIVRSGTKTCRRFRDHLPGRTGPRRRGNSPPECI
ncbi:unnamed protein product, partial [Protopolystoma xenopodis]